MWLLIYNRFLLVKFHFLFSDYATSLKFFFRTVFVFLFISIFYCDELIRCALFCNRQDGVYKFPKKKSH